MNWLFKIAFAFANSVLLLTMLPTSLWLLFNAQTAVGHQLAVAGLLVTAWPWCLRFAWRKHNAKIAMIFSAGVIGLLSAIMWQSPTGKTAAGAALQQRFVSGIAYPRFSIANIIPEVEQAHFGFFVARFADRLFGRAQEHQLRGLTTQLYREAKADKDFRQIGTALGWGYREILGLASEPGHYFLYVPKAEKPGPMPVLLFLHGSGGNFKTYLWIWTRFAKENGFVIVAPTGGFGNWGTDRLTAVKNALEDAAKITTIDHNRVYLAGLSNGGLGVSRLGATSPDLFRGFVFISPVLDKQALSEGWFKAAWRGKPVLILTGSADDRIPEAYVKEGAAQLKENGAVVKEVYYPGANHFLFYSHATNLLMEVSEWVKK